MVGVSLAGFVSANKYSCYSHLRKCKFYRQTSSLFDLDCHFHAIYVTLLHINVHLSHIFFARLHSPLIGGQGIVLDYLYAKFGDFSFSRFGFIMLSP